MNQAFKFQKEEKGEPKGTRKVHVLESPEELPAQWWVVVPNDRTANNYRTRTHVVGIPVETLLDGGAGL